MRNKIYNVCLMALLMISSLSAQRHIELIGIVLGQDSLPVVGANVALYAERDSSMVVGVTTNVKGAFRLSGSIIDKGFVRISFMGLQTQQLGLVNVRESIDLGQIFMEEEWVNIEGVEVVASGQRQELDRLIVYPDREQIKSATTPFDLLANMMLPGLNVDVVSRTASLFDKEVEFRINGRKVTVRDIDALTASNIQKVEYVDNPDLSYGKEVGAVINYVTKEPITGFSTSGSLLNAAYVAFGNDFVNMRWNHKNSEFGMSYNTMFRKYSKRRTDQSQLYAFPDGRKMEREYVGENTPFLSLPHNLTLFYNLMKRNNYLFSVIARMAYSKVEKNYTASLLENGLSKGRQTSQNNTNSILPELDLYFSKQFSKKRSLSLNVVGGYANSDMDYAYEEEGDAPFSIAFNAEGKRYNLISEAKYIHPINPFVNLTLGLQDRYFKEEDQYSNESDLRVTEHNNFRGYVRLNGSVGKFQYIVGLGGMSTHYAVTNRSFTFGSFQPWISLGYKLSKSSMLRYHFEASSEDPKVSELNDVEQRVNPWLLSKGDASTESYMVYDNQLSYSYTGRYINLQLYGSHEYRNNPVTDLIYYDEARDLFVNTYHNQGNRHCYTTSLYTQFKGLFNNILSLSAQVKYVHFKTRGEGYRHHLNVVQAQFQANANYKDFSFQLTANTRDKSLVGERVEMMALSSIAQLMYNQKHYQIGLGLFHPFELQWDAGNEFRSALLRKRSWTSIRENGRMLFVRFTWNFSTGRGYKSGNKELSNQGGKSGLSSMPVME